MKRLLILLLLAGCDSQRDGNGDGAVPAAGGIGLEDPMANAGVDPALLQARAQTAVGAAILDPASARYANLREGSGGSICGDVNAKGEDGRLQGFRPFVVTPQGVAVVSSAATIAFDNPADIYPDFYLRYCAPLEELPTLHSKMAGGNSDLPPAPDAGPPAPLDLPPLDLPTRAPPPPPPPPSARQPAAPKPQPKAQDEDSFFNAVIRPQQEPK